MRSVDGHTVAQRYRVINKSRKLKVMHRTVIPPDVELSTKRFSQSKLKHMPQGNLSPHRGDFPEECISSMSEMEYITEPELEQTDNEKQHGIKSMTSTIRPLLQLLSDDSCSPKNSATPLYNIEEQKMSHEKHQIVYKNISLSSEEDDDYKEQSIFQDGEVRSAQRHNHMRPRVDSLSRFEWSPKSTNIFLDLWEKNLKDIRGTRKNSHIHKEMADEMSEYGPSHREIKSKMDNMSRKFRMEMKKIKSGTPTNWRYFKRVQSLLVGTPSVDFEEIIFDNTESSTFFNADSSDAEHEFNNFSHEENEAEQQTTSTGHVVEGPTEEQHDQKNERKESPPPTISISQKEEELQASSRGIKSRMLEIEEQKLAVEKQKLLVMNHISRELTSISKTLAELLRNAK